MRATPDQRDTSDLEEDSEALRSWILERVERLVNTGCIIAFAGERADEAEVLILEINTAVHELAEQREELAQRGR